MTKNHVSYMLPHIKWIRHFIKMIAIMTLGKKTIQTSDLSMIGKIFAQNDSFLCRKIPVHWSLCRVVKSLWNWTLPPVITI